MKKNRKFTIAIAACAAVLTAGIVTVSGIDLPYTEPEGIEVEYAVMVSDAQMGSFDLRTRTAAYLPLSDGALETASPFAYLWITLRNTGGTRAQCVLANASFNYHTEFLAPSDSGAVTLFRHGDTVRPSTWAFNHPYAAFPFDISAGAEREFIVEFHGPRGLAVEPILVSAAGFTNRASVEWIVMAVICGAASLLILLNLASALIQGRPIFYAAVIFTASIFFFYLRQSRILLVLFDLPAYPEWLYPLSIFLNLASAAAFAYVLIRASFTPVLTASLWGLVGIGAVFAALSVAYLPYAMADALNFVSILVLVLVLVAVVRAVRVKNIAVLWVVLAFSPWILMMLLDILRIYAAARGTGLEQYAQAFGLVSALFLLSLVLQRIQNDEAAEEVSTLTRELEGAKRDEVNHLAELSGLRLSILRKTSFQLRQPLESILASARILAREYADPKIAAAGQVIFDEAADLKRRVDRAVGEYGSEDDWMPGADREPELSEPMRYLLAENPAGHSSGKVLVYDFSERQETNTGLILRSAGFEVSFSTNRYETLDAVMHGRVDVLIVDPSSGGEHVFGICSMVRTERNLFEQPILMITNFGADYLMKQGYAAGINDFLTRPVDTAEMILRVHSLVQLRKVAGNNQELARSETVKNAFLFFLTHNINTPLTILINRVRDLEELASLDELAAIIDDLTDSTREIHDIVQNVLIAFRLADSRQTVRLESVDLEEIVDRVRRDLWKKAREKEQSLVFSVPEDLPPVRVDRTSVRGIIHNLVDNAVKFTPPGGSVSVEAVADDLVQVIVSDTGPGIPAHDLPRLFGRFEKLSPRPTRGESSTGLGLFVARELARLCGGNLEYRRVETGAQFILSLPRYFPGGRDDQ